MRVAVDCGFERLEFEVAREGLIASRPPPAALPGPSAAAASPSSWTSSYRNCPGYWCRCWSTSSPPASRPRR